MDGSHFDAVTRALFQGLSRRRVGRGLAAAVLGIAGLHVTADSGAGKIKRNRFGCVNVGDPCRGRDSVCCSGICKGKRPKRGERDKSRCVAHDARGCKVEDDSCRATETTCTTSLGQSGFCHRTTGKAGYCAEFAECFPCSKDADCQQFCGSDAACGVCANFCDGTNGNGKDTGGRECFSLQACVFPP